MKFKTPKNAFYLALGGLIAVVSLTTVLALTVFRVQNPKTTIEQPKAAGSIPSWCSTPPDCCKKIASGGGFDSCGWPDRGQCFESQCAGSQANSTDKCYGADAPKCRCAHFRHNTLTDGSYACGAPGDGPFGTGGGGGGGSIPSGATRAPNNATCTCSGTSAGNCNQCPAGYTWCYGGQCIKAPQSGSGGSSNASATSGGGCGTSTSCADQCFAQTGNCSGCQTVCANNASCYTGCVGASGANAKMCLSQCNNGSLGSCTTDNDCAKIGGDKDAATCSDRCFSVTGNGSGCRAACAKDPHAYDICVAHGGKPKLCVSDINNGTNTSGAATLSCAAGACLVSGTTHLACGVSNTCVRVSGIGSDQNGCSAVGGSCQSGGGGGNSCTTDANCPSGQVCLSGACTDINQTHLGCSSSNSCVHLAGSGNNTDGCTTLSASCVPGGEENQCWGNQGVNGRCYDPNGDGVINILDFSCLASVYLSPIPVSGSAPKCGQRL